MNYSQAGAKRRAVLLTFYFEICCCLLNLAFSNTVARAQAKEPTFEVATVKAAPGADPNTGLRTPPGVGRFSAMHLSLLAFLQLAYGMERSQIIYKDGWVGTNLYDVEAKPEAGVALTREELRPRLQALLQQRFHLQAHTETRDGRGFALTVSKGGPHLTATKGDHFPGFRVNVSPGQMRGLNWSMPIFAKYLTSAAGFPVVDRTGLSGSYDISFSYDPQPNADSSLPSLQDAVMQATGLVLKPQSVPVEVLVVDAADPTPTAN